MLNTSGIRKFLAKDSKVTLQSHLHLIAFFQWYPKSFMPLYFFLWIPPEAVKSLCDNPARGMKHTAVYVAIASVYIKIVITKISIFGSYNALSQRKHTCWLYTDVKKNILLVEFKIVEVNFRNFLEKTILFSDFFPTFCVFHMLKYEYFKLRPELWFKYLSFQFIKKWK